MTWITTTAPAQATGTTAETYHAVQQTWGMVPNAILALSSSPQMLAWQWEFIRYSMAHPHISGELQTWLRLLVSQRVRCDYCIDVNVGLLLELHGRSSTEVEAAQANPTLVPLPERERALLQFATTYFRGEQVADPATVATLRAHGWEDGDLLDILLMATRQAAIDAIFVTLAVEPDAH